MKKCLLFMCVLFMSTAMMAQPANDDCANAEAITLNDAVNFSTLMATMDGVNHTACLGANDSIPADIWFTWTAPSDGNYNWTNCGTGVYDSRMAVYENPAACTPTDAELIACNDDGPAASCASFESSMTFTATMGNSYHLRLGGFSPDPDSIPTMGSGTVTLTKLPDGPDNDNCADAIAIGLGMTNFSTINATIDGPEHPGNSSCFGFGQAFVEADIWYTYTADFDGFVKWETCGTINFDSRMVVYSPGSACPPVQDDLYECNDDSGCPMFHSTIDFEVVNGETYLLELGGYTGESGTGSFTLEEFIPPTPPDNDNCADADLAYVITPETADSLINGVFFGTTLFASSEADYVDPVCTPFNPGGDFNDVWYAFNSAGNTELEIRFTPVILEDARFMGDIFEVCGTQDTIHVGNCFINDDGMSVRDTLLGLPDVPTDYLLRITTRLTTESPGEFFFQIVGGMTTSTEDELAAVEQMTIAPNPTNDIANVDFNISESKQLAMTVTNNVGAIVQHQSARNFSAGSHRIELDMDELPAGIYFVSINDGKTSKVEKLVKL